MSVVYDWSDTVYVSCRPPVGLIFDLGSKSRREPRKLARDAATAADRRGATTVAMGVTTSAAVARIIG